MQIYLDYAATTPMDPRVAESMMQHMMSDGVFGNAHSTHVFGQAAKKAVDQARAQVAQVISATAEEILWTSGATESINLALKGAASLYQQKGRHIITLKTEHAAVLDCCQHLEKNGFQVTYLTPHSDGLLDPAQLGAAIRDDTILVSIMQVNNETGVIQNLAAIANDTSQRCILLHVDAAQSVGKTLLNVQELPVDLISLSAHKVYGPKGVGALYVRRKPRVRVAAQMHGGGHEHGMRSGTLAVHQIVGMGAAFQLAGENYWEDCQRAARFKQYLYQQLHEKTGALVNGHLEQSVPQILNLRFPGLHAREWMQANPELAVSVGSACHAKGTEPSHVLRAMGLNVAEAKSSLRFSFGRFTTQEEIDFAIALFRA